MFESHITEPKEDILSCSHVCYDHFACPFSPLSVVCLLSRIANDQASAQHRHRQHLWLYPVPRGEARSSGPSSGTHRMLRWRAHSCRSSHTRGQSRTKVAHPDDQHQRGGIQSGDSYHDSNIMRAEKLRHTKGGTTGRTVTFLRDLLLPTLPEDATPLAYPLASREEMRTTVRTRACYR